MLRRAERLMDQMGSVNLFTQSGVDFITEAWAAAKFDTLRSTQSVRLVAERERWPDFQLQAGGQKQQWEFTEADVPGRRRGDEYRAQAEHVDAAGSFVQDDPVEGWIARAQLVPTALGEAVRRKLAQRYAHRVPLLIYLNINEYGIR